MFLLLFFLLFVHSLKFIYIMCILNLPQVVLQCYFRALTLTDARMGHLVYFKLKLLTNFLALGRKGAIRLLTIFQVYWQTCSFWMRGEILKINDLMHIFKSETQKKRPNQLWWGSVHLEMIRAYIFIILKPKFLVILSNLSNRNDFGQWSSLRASHIYFSYQTSNINARLSFYLRRRSIKEESYVFNLVGSLIGKISNLNQSTAIENHHLRISRSLFFFLLQSVLKKTGLAHFCSQCIPFRIQWFRFIWWKYSVFFFLLGSISFHISVFFLNTHSFL